MGTTVIAARSCLQSLRKPNNSHDLFFRFLRYTVHRKEFGTTKAVWETCESDREKRLIGTEVSKFCLIEISQLIKPFEIICSIEKMSSTSILAGNSFENKITNSQSHVYLIYYTHANICSIESSAATPGLRIVFSGGVSNSVSEFPILNLKVILSTFVNPLSSYHSRINAHKVTTVKSSQ